MEEMLQAINENFEDICQGWIDCTSLDDMMKSKQRQINFYTENLTRWRYIHYGIAEKWHYVRGNNDRING